MIGNTELSEILGDLYSVWDEENPMRQLLMLMHEIMDANHINLTISDVKTNNNISAYALGLNSKIKHIYIEYHKDNHYRFYPDSLPMFELFSNDSMEELITKNENTDFHEVFLKSPCIHQETYSVLLECKSKKMQIQLHRTEQQKAFNEKEIILFKILAPHVKQSILANNKIHDLKKTMYGLMQFTNKNSHLLILLDKDFSLIYANEMAEDLLNNGVLSTKEKKVHFSNIETNKNFMEICKQSMAIVSGEIQSNTKLLFTRRLVIDDESYFIHIAPWKYDSNILGVKEIGMLATFKKEQMVSINTSIIRSVFGFTQAESDIVKLVCEGNSTKTICIMRNCKESTVTFHLKSIYSKLNIKRKSELVEKIMGVLL